MSTDLRPPKVHPLMPWTADDLAWYDAQCIRALAYLVDQGASDRLLLAAARGYAAGRPKLAAPDPADLYEI